MPKLVVCVTVDQLRGDYIEYFYNTFGERGFKRLLNEGLVYKNIRFEFSNVGSGNSFRDPLYWYNPCYNGISGDNVYDLRRDKELPSLNDPAYLGNYTHDNYSPKNLISSTIGDELKIASNGRSDVCSPLPRMHKSAFYPDMLPTELSGLIILTVNGLLQPTIRMFPGM